MDEYRADVVAGKYDAKLFDPTGVELLVNEVFHSIQGEGAHAGESAVFVRLAKCNLACKFCDTEFETFQTMTFEKLAERVWDIAPSGASQVILTGGEPVLQNCALFINQMKRSAQPTAIETSGSVWAPWVRDVDWVCVSPKVPVARIPEELKAKANEYKWIVNQTFLSMYERNPLQCWMPDPALNFLQPEWGPNREKFTAAAIKLVLANPTIYRLSMQMHKFAGVP